MQTRRSQTVNFPRIARPPALVLALALSVGTSFASPIAGPIAAAPSSSAPIRSAAFDRMGAYTGQSPRSIPAELRRRARFVGHDLSTLASPPDEGCVVLQSPAAGEELGPDTQVAFLVSSTVPTPDFQGLSLAAAQQLAEYFCLSVTAVPSCDGDESPTSAAPTSIVAQQCTPPETPVDIGNQIGVVVSPADDPQPLLMGLLILAATLAVLAAAFALLFYVRYASARDELAIFKQPRKDK